MEQWYVVHTKPRQEKVAEENLTHQGYRCFLPLGRQWRKRRGRRYLSTEPFFPRYLFVRLNLGETNIGPIRSTLGVTGLVRFGKHILPVPETFMESLKSQTDTEGVIGQDPPDFKAGQMVLIEEGVLTGYRAIFQAKSGEERALLLLSLLGSQSQVEVPLAALSPDD